MAKKKKKKSNQVFLSPESYIKNKSRDLEIEECIVNEDWYEGGLAQVIVARKHKNGNITMGLFLVDTFCLGVKNSLYRFNISPYIYEEFKEEIFDGEGIKIDYILAHNIIYGAVEYAEDYGFFPDKIFQNITKYILEDDEDVEIIDLEFGKEGKPLLVVINKNEPYHGYISTLDKTAGPGNYSFMLPGGETSKDIEVDDDNNLFGFREFLNPLEYDQEQEKLILEISNELLNEGEIDRLKNGKRETDEITLKTLLRLFEYKFAESISDDEAEEAYYFGLELFEGLEIDDKALVDIDDILPEEAMNLFIRADELIERNKPEKALKILKNLVKVHPDKPFLLSKIAMCYMDMNKAKKFNEVAMNAYNRFPDDLGIRIDYLNYLLVNDKIDEALKFLTEKGFSLKEMYPDKDVFFRFDVQAFYAFVFSFFIFSGNMVYAKSLLFHFTPFIDDIFLEKLYLMYFEALLEKYNNELL